jgi:long-chain acyl-CoA synthetase
LWLSPGQSVTEAEFIEHCRRHIASYQKPKSVDFVDALPRLPPVGCAMTASLDPG